LVGGWPKDITGVRKNFLFCPPTPPKKKKRRKRKNHKNKCYNKSEIERWWLFPNVGPPNGGGTDALGAQP